MKAPPNTAAYSGIIHLAYGVHIERTDPFALDDYDLWFGNDFNYVVTDLFNSVFDIIEEQVSSDWSENQSELESARRSAQESANREAKLRDGVPLGAGEESSMPTLTADSFMSVTVGSIDTEDSEAESDDASVEGTHTTYSDFESKHFSPYYPHHPIPTSVGTSRELGVAHTVDTPSIVLQETLDHYANHNNFQTVNVQTVTPSPGSHYGNLGGVEWIGDQDNEYIFGTSWLDKLYGNEGDDIIYGLESNDLIVGGLGTDRLFGDGGDDIIWTATQTGLTPPGDEQTTGTDFASGGSGNDKIYGEDANPIVEQLFGGSGDDIIKAYGGSDIIDGGEGNDTITAGADLITPGNGMNTVHGGGGIDLITGGGDNDDLHGDGGDDTIMGGYGDDDIHGGDGNDIIDGGEHDDILHGDDGDDLIQGGLNTMGTSMLDVIHGGAGDDTIFGGTYDDTSGTPVKVAGAAVTQEIWIDGGSGNDEIWGQDMAVKQSIWGGTGWDDIHGGNMVTNQYLYGLDDDDTIHPGQSAVTQLKVEGGKGNDVINQIYKWDATESKYGFKQKDWAGTFTEADIADSAKLNAVENFYGNQGDDTIWAGYGATGAQKIIGGTGNDKLYGGFDQTAEENLTIEGNGGSDLIRTDWWEQFGDPAAEGLKKSYGNEYIYGDYKYGVSALDEDIWGNADSIYGGDASPELSTTQKITAGDGNDKVVAGNDWKNQMIYGGNDDDQIFLGTGVGLNGGITKYAGEGGNDTIKGLDYSLVVKAHSGNEGIYGGAGNDTLHGSHKLYGEQKIYGGAGNDAIYGGREIENDMKQILSGNAGNDEINGGDGMLSTAAGQYIHGDTWDQQAIDVADYAVEDTGNDKIRGGNDIAFNQFIYGGYGDDQIWGGTNIAGAEADFYGDDDNNTEASKTARMPLLVANETTKDGNDTIDVGDNAAGAATVVRAFGQGGNDSILGGVGNMVQNLYGGSGDDKIWRYNPGQVDSTNGMDYIAGNFGNDVIYGSTNSEVMLYGDWKEDYGMTPGFDKYDVDGGDDIIYTGINDPAMAGDKVWGGGGNDKIIGQGTIGHYLYGGYGDDHITGGDGDDHIFGDDKTNLQFGNDKLYGGKGADKIYGGIGEDIIKGGEGDDTIDGQAGGDTIWGDAGADIIDAGYGLDTVFGGDGCDTLTVADGGDVVWLGACPAADATDQKLTIYGTGLDIENYVVIMDFWLSDAVTQNQLCLEASKKQMNPTYPVCTVPVGADNCLTAANVMGGTSPAGTTTGAGCQDDGGPLWISIPLTEFPVGTMTTGLQVWASINQKKAGFSHPTSSPVTSHTTGYSTPSTAHSYSTPTTSQYQSTHNSYRTVPAYNAYSKPAYTSPYSKPSYSSTYTKPSSYSTRPTYSSYVKPSYTPNTTYSSYTTPKTSYSTPKTSYLTPKISYTTPKTSYSSPSYSSYTTPKTSYQTPKTSYSSYTTPKTSYSSYTKPSYGTSSYSRPTTSYSNTYSKPTTSNSTYRPSSSSLSYSKPKTSYSAYSTPSYSYSKPSTYSRYSYGYAQLGAETQAVDASHLEECMKLLVCTTT